MERKKIIRLSKKNINCENLEKARKTLENNYEVSYGKYDAVELKKAINDQSPLFIQNHLIIGHEDGKFINDKNEKVSIDKMVKALIIEDELDDEDVIIEDTRDDFMIIGKTEWDGNKGNFNALLNKLKVGEVFLPPHSLVFNFIKPSESQIKEKIVSMLSGVNVNIYSENNYVDNTFHEIGHAFWRDCVKGKERKLFKELWKRGKASAIYEYSWERMDEEEMFCTIYKLYIKSMLINRSFLNILEHEEPDGLKLLQSVLDRISKQKMVDDIWELNKDKVNSYLHPKLDRTTGKRIVKQGTFDDIKDIEIPDQYVNDLNRVQDGIKFINLNKAVVPVKGNKIDWHNMEKAKGIK